MRRDDGYEMKHLTSLIATSVLLLSGTGCASLFIRDIGRSCGGEPSVGAKVGAAAFDVVTLPVQAVVIVPLVIKNELVDEPQREQAAEEDSRLLQESVSMLTHDPEAAVSGDYLNRGATSYQYRALCTFIQANITNKYPDSLFRYLYENANEDPHRHLFVSIMRNPNIPQDCLNAEFERLMKTDGREWTLFDAVLANPRLSTERIESATSHSDGRVSAVATYCLPDRYAMRAADPGTDINRLVALSANGWNRIRAAVAANPSTPPEVLCCMMSDADCEVCRNIADNPNTPSDVLRDLLSDPDETISSVARKNLDSRSRHVLQGRENVGAEAAEGQAGEPLSVLTVTDLQVLQAVVHDWDLAKESICLQGRTNGIILVHSSTAREHNPAQIRADTRGRNLPHELVLAFIKRNLSAACIPMDISADGRTVITNVEDRTIFHQTYRFPELYPTAKSFMHFCLPAYTDSGNTALVRFDFGPTHHGATCTYLLRRENDRWIVVWKKTAYYA